MTCDIKNQDDLHWNDKKLSTDTSNKMTKMLELF